MKAYFKLHPRTKKKIHAERWREKKISCKHIPREKNSRGIKGLKKNSCLYQITQPPPPPEVKWLAPKAPCDFPPRKDGILCPRRVVLGLPSPSHRVCGRTDVRMYGCTDGRSRDYYVTTEISRIDRLPYFLSNGAPLAGFARRLRYYYKNENSPSCVCVLHKTLNLVISRCSCAQNGKEIFQK